jgi:hypothetical protein
VNLRISAHDVGRQFIDIHGERCDAILQILADGWERASVSSDVHRGAGEVEITECLRIEMREALKAKDADWCKKMTVLPGTESRSSPDLRKPDGRTDIPILFQEIREELDEHNPHAIVECKRIAGSNADLCRLYVVEGIDRFKTGKYAGNHAVGFMAGYLLSDDGKAATGGINRYLTGQGRQLEHLGPSSIPDVLWAWSSRHPRVLPAEPIHLHHAFLAMRPAAV